MEDWWTFAFVFEMKLLKRSGQEFVASFVNLLEEVPVEPTE